MQATPDPRAKWQDALLAARILSVAGANIGGIHLRSGSGPVRQAWLEAFSDLAGNKNLVTIPVTASMDRLCGGMDVHATLSTGKVEIQTGLLAKANNGFAVISGAERLESSALGAITSALETKAVAPYLTSAKPADPCHFGLIAIDEAAPGETGLNLALKERLALTIDLDGIAWSSVNAPSFSISAEPAQDIHAINISEALLETAIKAMETQSLRRLFLTLTVAKTLAALERRKEISLRDLLTAVRLSGQNEVEPDVQEENQQQAESQNSNDDMQQRPHQDDRLPDDIMIDATLADIAGIELTIETIRSASRIAGSRGTSGEKRNKARRGRVLGLRERPPFADARPDIVATLRAAAPWQLIRRRERAAKGLAPLDRVILHTNDFRYRHFQDRRESAIIFAVDASGSTAMDRLGEAKGAIELLLAECYAERHHVGLVAFRGEKAETLLAPTRSLVRAKRSLQALPGGGTTPLASGLKRATELAMTAKSKGQTPLMVIISDGSGNIDLEGNPGRVKANEDTMKIARTIAGHKISSMVIDIGRRGAAKALPLAKAMGGEYKPLPYASARAMRSFIQPHMTNAKK